MSVFSIEERMVARNVHPLRVAVSSDIVGVMIPMKSVYLEGKSINGKKEGSLRQKPMPNRRQSDDEARSGRALSRRPRRVRG